MACILLFSVGSAAKRVADSKYYDILGVLVTASEPDLRKAYHKLALKWHPDKHSQMPDARRKKAEDMFKEISLAYGTLSDPEKRRTYDQVGEEGMKRGEKGGHGFQAGGFDPSSIFEQFFRGFAGGGGGGGFAFNFDMGGGDAGPRGLFADHADEVETLQEEDELQRLIEESSSEVNAASKQFLVVLCIESNGDCKQLKPAIVKLARSHKGGVPFHAVDCISRPMLCRLVEADVKVYPCFVYFGYGRRLPYGVDSEGGVPSPGKPTPHGIRTWLARAVPERVAHVRTVSDRERFLSSSTEKAKVVLLTKKPGTPPRLKALSMELEEHLAIAVVSEKLAPEAFEQFATAGPGQRAPESFPVLYNVQTREFVSKSGDELHSYLNSLAEESQARKAMLFEELTLAMHADGVCGADDNKFCLLVVFPEGAAPEVEQLRPTFSRVAEEFRKEKSDPLRVFYVVVDKVADALVEPSTELGKLLSAAGFADFAPKAVGALLWRPKWARFEKFGGRLSDPAEVLGFLRSAFVSVALDGGSGLTFSHQEL